MSDIIKLLVTKFLNS